MRTNAVIVLIVFLIWGLGSTYWYVCKIKGLCVEEKDISKMTSNRSGNLLFVKGSSIPETNQVTVATLDSIRNLDFDTLQVNGISYLDESKNLGLARAESLRDLLLGHGIKRPIAIGAKYSEEKILGKVKAFEISSITNPVENVAKSEKFSIEKKDEKTIVYFPSASADPHTSDKLMDNLQSLADEVIASKSSVEIIGHTDNSGTHELNLKYGQLRADAIATLLIEFGISRGLIRVRSMGESEPIASNDNEEGKRKNRRVEIITLDN